MRSLRAKGRLWIVGLLMMIVVATIVTNTGSRSGNTNAGAADVGIQKIKHVVVVMMENRSFDSYFGTFPRANGILDANGALKPNLCNPDPDRGTCVEPYVNHLDVTTGGPHAAASHVSDVHGGLMDGFISTVEKSKGACTKFWFPECSDGPVDQNDVMGYKVQSDIPNYWKYAKNFVLQDNMFEPTSSWSLPAHLFQVSGWSADCTSHAASSCTNTISPTPSPPDQDPTKTGGGPPNYSWTDMTYLLFHHVDGNNNPAPVSWRYYVTAGTEPDCENDAALSCTPVKQNPRTPGIWNPLPFFDTVKADHQLGNIQSVSSFYTAAKAGTLPAVSWVTPSGDVSDHPPSTTSAGQSYVTSLVNAVMSGPNWKNTAIFVTWDDWGGFYDHVVPPVVDVNGYGIRVPGLLISAYAKKGYVDHQVLSFDAYNKFIEDRFLGSRRLDPATDGRWDPRTNVRENLDILGNLADEFDFTQTPRPVMLLPVRPVTTLTDRTPFQPLNLTAVTGNSQAKLTWQSPYSNGGTPITGYKVTPYKAGVAQPVRTIAISAPGCRVCVVTLTGLTNGQQYRFKVAAVNKIGTGLSTNLTPPITIGAPLAPTNVSATAATNGQGSADVSWTAPTSDNGSAITGYAITPFIGFFQQPCPSANTDNCMSGAAVTTKTISGLTNGQTYTFRVRAINARGQSAPSTNSNAVTPN